jgi:hypothetical protein
LTQVVNAFVPSALTHFIVGGIVFHCAASMSRAALPQVVESEINRNAVWGIGRVARPTSFKQTDELLSGLSDPFTAQAIERVLVADHQAQRRINLIQSTTADLPAPTCHYEIVPQSHEMANRFSEVVVDKVGIFADRLVDRHDRCLDFAPVIA